MLPPHRGQTRARTRKSFLTTTSATSRPCAVHDPPIGPGSTIRLRSYDYRPEEVGRLFLLCKKISVIATPHDFSLTLYASAPYLCLPTTLLGQQGCHPPFTFHQSLLPTHLCFRVVPARDDLCPLIESPLGEGQAELPWATVRLDFRHPRTVRAIVRQLKLRKVCNREEGTIGAAAVVSEGLPDRKAPLICNEGCCSDPIFHAVVQTKMPSQIISRGK